MLPECKGNGIHGKMDEHLLFSPKIFLVYNPADKARDNSRAVYVRYILSLWKKELPVLLPVYLCFNFSAQRKAIWSLLTSYYIRSINILSDFGNVSITHNTHFFSWLEYAALCGSSFFIRTLLELYNGSNLVHIAFFKVHMETNNRVYTYFLPAVAGFPSVAPLSFYSRQCERYRDKHFHAPPAVS